MATEKSAHQEEKTFRNYDSKAATHYARFRPGWTDEFISNLISLHTSEGGELNVLLDVGCGPGTATRSLAKHFQKAIAVDPSASMVEVARGIPSATALGDPVRYEVAKAESLGSITALAEIGQAASSAESVDLITAATAAHWFDLDGFWVEAAKILRPGGSVILWTTGNSYVDPNTTPNAEKCQDLIDTFDAEVMVPFQAPGNVISRDLYKDLKMPWDVAESHPELKEQLSVFTKEKSDRQELNKTNQVAPGERFAHGGKVDFNTMKLILATASPVTRWREAHKEQLEKGEVEDCLDEFVRRSKDILNETEEGKGRDWVDYGVAVGIVIVRKNK